METKALKKQLGAAIAMVLVAAIALGAATFAWFVNNNAVTATDVDLSTTSSVPNLYITNAGTTTDGMTAAGTNPTKLYPVSTNDEAIKTSTFYETLHWVSGNGHAVADQYQNALTHEEGKTVYADYTFKLGVTNGKMNVFFDSGTAATTLAANAQMGTAGRFAIKFGNGNWTLFKVKGNATDNGYYTDKDATTGEYWVKQDGDTFKAVNAKYADFNEYAGSVDGQGQAHAGKTPLITLDSDQRENLPSEVTVTVRVWYEGCDKDCVYENAGSGIASAIKGNLGFVGVQPTSAPGVGA